ncbi:MAG: hypothetical protein ABSD69_00935 [Candidatus Levyibacteriota bacterium]|jgi:hypothetical protein
MPRPLETLQAYSVIEAQANEEGKTPDQFVGQRLGLAVIRAPEEAGEAGLEEFGEGNIVLLEITGGQRPSVIAHALVETGEDAAGWAALIKREKRIPDSSTFLVYELPPVEEFDVETGEAIFLADRTEPFGPHPVFSRSSIRWTNSRRS